MNSDILEIAFDAPTSSQPYVDKPTSPNEFFAKIVDPELGLTARDVIRIAQDEQVGLAGLLSTMYRGKFAGEIQPGSTKAPTIYTFNGVYWELDAQRIRGDYDRRLITMLSTVLYEILEEKVGAHEDYLKRELATIEAALKIVKNIRTFNVVIDKAFEGQNGCGVISSMWDQDKLTLTTCANIVDLKTGAIIEPNPEEYRRQHTNVEYFEKLEEPAALISMLRESLSLIGYPEPPAYADEKEFEYALNCIANPGYDLEFDFGPDPDKLAAVQRKLDEVRRSNAELRERYDQQMALWRSGKITDDVVSFIQVLLGYCILGTNPNEKFLIFVGDKGRNGKGLISHTLRNILGDYAFEARSETFMKVKQRGGGEATSDIMALKGRRVIFISKNDRGDAINAPLIKRITGHDEMAPPHRQRRSRSSAALYLHPLPADIQGKTRS